MAALRDTTEKKIDFKLNWIRIILLFFRVHDVFVVVRQQPQLLYKMPWSDDDESDDEFGGSGGSGFSDDGDDNDLSSGFGDSNDDDDDFDDDDGQAFSRARPIASIPTNERGKVILNVTHRGGMKRLRLASDDATVAELKVEIARAMGDTAGDPTRMELWTTLAGFSDDFSECEFVGEAGTPLHESGIAGRRKPRKIWARFVSDDVPTARFTPPPPPQVAHFVAPDRVVGIKGLDDALRAAGKFRLQVRDGRSLPPLESLGPDEREGGAVRFEGGSSDRTSDVVIVDEAWTSSELKAQIASWLYHAKGSLRLSADAMQLSTAGKHGYATQFVFPTQRLADIFDPPIVRDGSRSAVLVVRRVVAAGAGAGADGGGGAAAAAAPARDAARGAKGASGASAASNVVSCADILKAVARATPKFMRCPPAPIRGVRIGDVTRADPFLTLLTPKRRKLGLLLGDEGPPTSDGWVETCAVYEPPQCGFRDHVLLFPTDDEIYGGAEEEHFKMVRRELGLRVVGLILSVSSRTCVGHALGGGAEKHRGAAALTAAELLHVARLPQCTAGFPIVKAEFCDASAILAHASHDATLLRALRRMGDWDRLVGATAFDFTMGERGVVGLKLKLDGYALAELASASRKEKLRLVIWRLLFLSRGQLADLDAAFVSGDVEMRNKLGFACQDIDRMDAGAKRSIISLLEQHVLLNGRPFRDTSVERAPGAGNAPVIFLCTVNTLHIDAFTVSDEFIRLARTGELSVIAKEGRSKALAAGVAEEDVAFSFESSARRQVMQPGGGWSASSYVHVDNVLRPTAIASLTSSSSRRALAQRSVDKPGLRPPVLQGFRTRTRGGWQSARRGIMAGQFPDYLGTNQLQLTSFLRTQQMVRKLSLLEIFSDWSLLLHMARLRYFSRTTSMAVANGASDATMRQLLAAVRSGNGAALDAMRVSIAAVQNEASRRSDAELKMIVSECDERARVTFEKSMESSAYEVRQAASEISREIARDELSFAALDVKVDWSTLPPGRWEWLAEESSSGGGSSNEVWREYADDVAQAMLESALQSNVMRCDLAIEGREYTVEFRDIGRSGEHGTGRGTQHSTASTKSRSIRRRPKGAAAGRPPLYPLSTDSGASAMGGRAPRRPTRRDRGGGRRGGGAGGGGGAAASKEAKVSTMSPDEVQKMAQLRDFTACDDDAKLRHCLVSASWDVQRAAGLMFDS